jgi:hypothetical protein
MAQKKAFVRYAQNKAVPGSLIVRTKAPKVGTWKEVPYNLCCGNTEETVQIEVSLADGFPFVDIYGAQILLSCAESNPPFNSAYYYGTSTVATTITNYSDLVNYLNTYFNYPGLTWLLTGPTTLEVIVDKSLLNKDCLLNFALLTIVYPA